MISGLENHVSFHDPSEERRELDRRTDTVINTVKQLQDAEYCLANRERMLADTRVAIATKQSEVHDLMGKIDGDRASVAALRAHLEAMVSQTMVD